MPKLLLTDKLLRTLSTDQAQEDFWDTSLPGFGVRISRQGRQTFFFSYRTPGERYSSPKDPRTLPPDVPR